MVNYTSGEINCKSVYYGTGAFETLSRVGKLVVEELS